MAGRASDHYLGGMGNSLGDRYCLAGLADAYAMMGMAQLKKGAVAYVFGKRV